MSDTATRLFKLLVESDDICSGAALSRSLHVSRNTIWKIISRWRSLGFEFDSASNRGYLLTAIPNRLLPEIISYGLRAKLIGKKIVYHEKIDSTNMNALALARAGAPEGTLAIAESQTSGRGRLGRNWVSPPFQNIYCSLVLHPSFPPEDIFLTVIAATVAVKNALADVFDISADIKWPNDVLVKGRKIAGILAECESDADSIHFAVVGIGVNVLMKAAQHKNIAGYSTSVSEIFVPAGEESFEGQWRATLLRKILERYEDAYMQIKKGKSAAVVNQWKKSLIGIGRSATIRTATQDICGIFTGVDARGSALIKQKNKKTITVSSGDLFLAR